MGTGKRKVRYYTVLSRNPDHTAYSTRSFLHAVMTCDDFRTWFQSLPNDITKIEVRTDNAKCAVSLLMDFNEPLESYQPEGTRDLFVTIKKTEETNLKKPEETLWEDNDC